MKPLEMGIYDDLDLQIQPLLNVDVFFNNIVVFGSHMTGKTSFIKTLLVRMHDNIEDGDMEEVYIIDFGGNLGAYEKLPLVAACFDNSNEENIRRIFFTVNNRLKSNTKRLGSEQFAEVYRNSNPENRPMHITLIIDNINSFLADERYMSYQDELLRFCRNGLSKGLSVIFTASDISSGMGRYMSSFNKKYAFDVPAENYIDIFGMKTGISMKNPGRGVSIVNGKIRELQAFLPFENEHEELSDYILSYPESNYKAEKLQSFGEELNLENFTEYSKDNATLEETESDGDYITVGLCYYEHTPIRVNLKDMHTIAVYGKKGYGKSNLTRLLVESIRRKHPDYRIVLVDDGRKQLEELHIQNSDNSVYFNKIEQLSDYLDENGYAPKGSSKGFVKQKTPPTVFVLQNKMLFQSSGKNLLSTFSRMNADAEENGYYFIYSDVRKISNNDTDTESYINNSISAAFLLDSISEFITNKGSRSVFKDMDPKELKSIYAKIEIGDGYFYDIESEVLTKFKMIKS